MIVCSAFIIGYILSKYQIILPFTLETAFVACAFMYIGFIMQKVEIYNKKESFYYFIICCILMTICIYMKHTINMLGHSYNQIILFLIGALAGTYIIIYISKFISKFNFKFLKYLGENSMIILVSHEPIKRIIIKVISIISKTNENIMRNNIFYSIIILAITISIIIPGIYLINKYIPYIIGKTPKKNNNTIIANTIENNNDKIQI